MGIFRRAMDWFTLANVPVTRHNFDATIIGPMPIDQAVREMLHGSPGRVSRAEALSVPAVKRGRDLICSIATLPLVQYGPDRSVVRLPLLEEIDPDVANEVTLAQTVEDLLFEGVSWWRVTRSTYDDFPLYAQHLAPSRVTVQPRASVSPPSPLPSGLDPRDAEIYVDGAKVADPASELIRFDSLNPPLLVTAARAIRQAVLLSQAAEMYADNPKPLDYFTPRVEGVDPDDDYVDETLSKWRRWRKQRSTAWVPSAVTYNTVDTPTPADLQLAELQKQVWLEIANSLGLDPEDLGISTTSRTYQNAVDRRKDRINDVLSPYMKAITGRLSMGDVTKRGYRVAFDLDDYLRADPTTRWNNYKTAKDIGAMTTDEIRAEESLPMLTSAQRRELEPAQSVPNNVRPLRSVAAGETQRASAVFDAPAHTFVNVPVQRFRVDTAQRTIEGLALPYNRVARRFRFAPGALQFAEMSRVKLLRDHDYSQAVGRLVHHEDSADGVLVRFKVARGADGDRALALADDGVVDGFSVGVDFTAEDTTPDPENPGVTLVHRADWREVSLTAQPAFDDARVTRVTASRTQGDEMPEDTKPVTEAAPVAVSADQAATFAEFAAFQQWKRDQIAQATAAAPIERAGVVNPVRSVAMATVTEPVPYRFDRKGNIMPAAHEFSHDVILGLKRGEESAEYRRVMDFVREQFAVVTTDVNELNPTRNRQDLYVDQRSFRYPVWDAISKGTLTDITPFQFPVFNSASGLVGANSEGSEPSSGSFTTTLATVTPTAISGKAKISRETWDQGGNPQIGNLIWRQMVKGYFENLEAAAVAVLDAASPTQIDFSGSPGLADDDLDQALTGAFADLQYVRGGFSMDNMFAQVDLYKALIAAKGQDGRRLYPALGPTNTNGTVRARFGALDINGITAYPAWALAATGTVAASSYLFDSESVSGWASAPQRLEITMTEVANVYIGLFGYKATIVNDINGVREILYDPS